jgi:hypothetical protein
MEQTARFFALMDRRNSREAIELIQVQILMLRGMCMNASELYEPSLTAGTVQATKSYNIGSLVYVAFFGGTLALTVLATRNARWLNVKPAVIRLLIAAAVVIFIAKMGFYYAYFHNVLNLERSSVKLAARGAEIALFGGFFLALKRPFKQHLVFGGDTISLKKDGILWCLVSIIVEGVIMVALAN